MGWVEGLGLDRGGWGLGVLGLGCSKPPAKVNMRNTDAIAYLGHDMICRFAWDLRRVWAVGFGATWPWVSTPAFGFSALRSRLGSSSVYATELPTCFQAAIVPTVYMPASNVLQLQRVFHT